MVITFSRLDVEAVVCSVPQPVNRATVVKTNNDHAYIADYFFVFHFTSPCIFGMGHDMQ